MFTSLHLLLGRFFLLLEATQESGIEQVRAYFVFFFLRLKSVPNVFCFVIFVEFRFTLLNILSCFFIYFNFIYRSRAALNVFFSPYKKYVSTTILIFYCVLANFFLFFWVKFCFRVSLSTHFSLYLFTLKYETSGLSTKVTHQVLLLCIFIYFSYFYFLFTKQFGGRTTT